jgi:hypothetical protein
MILRRLIRDQRGISSIEFVIVASVFFMLIFGMVDFSRAMWEWNAAAKATHWGVRYAVVNDMVAIRLVDFQGGSFGVDAGSSVPVGTVTAEFGTDTFTCTNTGCNGNGNTDDDFDVDAFGLIVARMQLIYDKIQPENVVVEYRHIGLGFSGDPFGPDLHPLVTVRLTGMTFVFVTPGLSGILDIDLPDFAATLTGEDLTSL